MYGQPDRGYYEPNFHPMPEQLLWENPNRTGHSQGRWNAPPQNPRDYARHPAAVNNVAEGGGNNAFKVGSHPPTNLERFRLFESMLRCHGHSGETKADYKTYLAIYWLEFSDLDTHLTSPLFENNASGHAENYLLEHLKLQLKIVPQERLKSIVIMQNASPCSECAKSYLEAMKDVLERNSEVQITIAFSSFHWLRRLSCRHEEHRHQFIPKEVHQENREGLRNLRLHDAVSGADVITVRTTCYEDWRKLCTALQIPFLVWLQSVETYNKSVRGQNDHHLKDDLQEIFS